MDAKDGDDDEGMTTGRVGSRGARKERDAEVLPRNDSRCDAKDGGSMICHS